MQFKYFVEVSSENSGKAFIEMQKDRFSDWHVVPPTDQWTRSLEPLLVGAILAKQF